MGTSTGSFYLEVSYCMRATGHAACIIYCVGRFWYVLLALDSLYSLDCSALSVGRKQVLVVMRS